jgi:endonuclease/exonuclease/phosphatase family metal-dependent hydrolase
MKKFLFQIIAVFILFISDDVHASVTVCSWNLMNFGKSKTEKTLDFIASSLQPFDVIAIEEVVAGNGGAQAVAKLVDIMNRKGKNWDYTISDPTSTTGNKSERYALIWNKSNVTKTGDAWLEKQFSREIEREPFMATFKKEGKLFTIASFHAVPKAAKPEKEIKYFKYIPSEYPSLNLIFCGDFNCPQSNSVFNPLKSMGYISALKNQKTTLRDRCIGEDCLASEFDNFFFDQKKYRLLKSGAIHFYRNFQNTKQARAVSDHIPIVFTFEVK